MTSPSPEYRRFIESLEAPLTTRKAIESLDEASLLRLKDGERDQAQGRLIDHLKTVADVRAVRALAILRNKTASKALQNVINRNRGGTEMEDLVAFEALQALVQRAELTNPVDAFIDFLKNGKARSRAFAADALAGFAEDRVVNALTEALHDEDRSVRSSASNALFSVSGLGRHATVIGTELWLLKHWLASPYPTIRDGAVSDLRDAVNRLQANTLPPPPNEKPPESPDMTRFLDSQLCPYKQSPWPDDFDLDSVRKLTGVERDWIEFSLIAQLDEGDPRIPRALAAMASTRGFEPLREILDKTTGEMREAVSQAIEVLENGPVVNTGEPGRPSR